MFEGASRRGITLDASMWPLVIVTFGTAVTDDDWRGMFRSYEDLYARKEPFHAVNDGIRVTSGIAASQRRLIGDAARTQEKMTRKWCLGGAAVATSALTRGMITAITWISPPAYKLTVHATLPEAVDEALTTLNRHGVLVPKSARTYRESLESR